MAPLARKNRLSRHAQVRPIVSRRIVGLIFKCNALRCGLGELFAATRRRQGSQRVGKTGSTMRHAIEWRAAEALASPAAMSRIDNTIVRQEVLAGAARAGKCIV